MCLLRLVMAEAVHLPVACQAGKMEESWSSE
jgi:hypothetical protein